MKSIAFFACCFLSAMSLFGEFHDEIPLLSPDMSAQELASATRFLSKVYYNTPNHDRVRMAKIIADQRLPGQLNRVLGLFNQLRDRLSEELIDKNRLSSTLSDFFQQNEHGHRMDMYGDNDPELLRVFGELVIEDAHPNDPLLHNDPKAIFLKSFLEDGPNYIQGVYADKIANAESIARRMEERYDALSPEEKAKAQQIIDVYGALLTNLEAFKALNGNALRDELANFMDGQDYRDMKERYDALKDSFAQGESIVLSNTLEDIINDDDGIED